MKQDNPLIYQWITGAGILVRLLLLALLGHLIVTPIWLLNALLENGSTTAGLVTGIYLVIVLPLALPEMIRTCGFRRATVGETRGSEGTTEASKQKVMELGSDG